MARTLGDTEHAQGFRFEWFERRKDNGALCGWFFPDDPEDGPDETHRLWITEIPAPPGEETAYFVQPGPEENPGWPLPSLDMAAAYLTGWFTGRDEW
ncbi:hypothetical protein ABZX64_32625 [Streptomyces misionensis]|uniref:hypothetical protein n=1 Tax=Streptomyces misionensis TaxID=67331 RepID=UPI0033BDF573